jgi:hypothetical protein
MHFLLFAKSSAMKEASLSLELSLKNWHFLRAEFSQAFYFYFRVPAEGDYSYEGLDQKLWNCASQSHLLA